MGFFKKPGEPSKAEQHRPTDSSEPRDASTASVYAILRRQKQRIVDLEREVSTLRRDVNRIDKKVYRAEEKPLIDPIYELLQKQRGKALHDTYPEV